MNSQHCCVLKFDNAVKRKGASEGSLGIYDDKQETII